MTNIRVASRPVRKRAIASGVSFDNVDSELFDFIFLTEQSPIFWSPLAQIVLEKSLRKTIYLYKRRGQFDTLGRGRLPQTGQVGQNFVKKEYYTAVPQLTSTPTAIEQGDGVHPD
jgi:hypothetical protein